MHDSTIVGQDLETIINAALPWEDLSGATVLVTGASGFLAAYLVGVLLTLNRCVFTKPVRIIALVRDAKRARERFALYGDHVNLEIMAQDVSDPLSFSEPLDYIIHAASQASPLRYLTDPVGTISANVMGTYRLLSAAQECATRCFLFFSSGAVYGDVANITTAVAENEGGWLDPLDDRSCYAESKRIGETMCASFARQFGVAARIVRPWHTYGPGMRLDDGRVFADFVRDILRGGPIVLNSDGSARRAFCYLADATAGFFTVLLKGQDGEAYNVANPDAECSIAELADRLATLYSAEGVTVERQRGSDILHAGSRTSPILPDVEKLRALGWSARCTIEEGFKRTVDSYSRGAGDGGGS